jgi:hypothetical protein
MPGSSTQNSHPQSQSQTPDDPESSKKHFSRECSTKTHLTRDLNPMTSPLEMLEIIAEGGPHNLSPHKPSKFTSDHSPHSPSPHSPSPHSNENSNSTPEGSSPARSPLTRTALEEERDELPYTKSPDPQGSQ